MALARFYFAMAVFGVIAPWFFFYAYFTTYGLDVPQLGQALVFNLAGAGFAASVLFSLLVFWVWSFADARRRKLAGWWVVLPAGLVAGPSLAMPLYFFIREATRRQRLP